VAFCDGAFRVPTDAVRLLTISGTAPGALRRTTGRDAWMR
jgi:hypothetical protein